MTLSIRPLTLREANAYVALHHRHNLGYDPYVMIYNKPSAPQEIRDLQRWCNNKVIFKSVPDFRDYKGRK